MKKHTPKLILLASAVAVAGMFAIPMIGSGTSADKAAPMNDPARVVAKKKGDKKGDKGQGDERSDKKGDNGEGGGKHGKKKGKKKK